MGLVGGALNLYFIYKFIRILTTPFASTDAFKLGIVDEKGKILKKKSKLKTIEEKEAYTIMHRLVWKLKRLMEKIPFGKSRLASYAAALWLIKEEEDFTGTNKELQESFLSFLETDWKNEALILKENYEGDMDKKTFSNLRTEGIDIKKADMKDVIKDFQSSDAPQFKGKSDKKKKEMAIAAKLSREEVEIDEATGNEIKKYMKSKWGISVNASKVGAGKFMRAMGDIPNEFRAHVMKKFFPDTQIKNKNNVDYGNIRDTYVSLKIDQWDELMKEEVEIEEEFWAVIDKAKGGEVMAISSDEKGAKSSVKMSNFSKHDYHFNKDPRTLKIVKVAGSYKKGERMIGQKLSYKEEVEIDEASSDTTDMYALMVKGLKAMPGSPKQKDIIKQINVIRKRMGMPLMKESAELDEMAPWKKGKYKVTDGKTGKVLGTFSSGEKAQKYVDKIWDKGDYDSLTVELGEEVVYARGVEIDEAKSKLPPHLAKFFDKKGNLKPEVAARIAKGKEKLNWIDVTPKGYGPKDEAYEIGTDAYNNHAKAITPGQLDQIVKEDEVDEKKVPKIKFKLKQFKHMKPKKKVKGKKSSSTDHQFAFGISRKGGGGVGSGYGTRGGMMFNSEGKFSQSMIDKLKKDYESLRGKRLSLGKNVELEKIVKSLAKDEDALVQLVKADIPFISMNARLLLHKDYGVPLNKYEEVEHSAFSKYITEGRPKQKPGFTPDATDSDLDRSDMWKKLADAQQKHYTPQDIQSIARKYKQRVADVQGGKTWEWTWLITLMNGIRLDYDYGSNTTTIKKWKLDKKKLEIYLSRYRNEHETIRDLKGDGGGIQVDGLEIAFEIISEGLMEEAPANSVAGGNVDLDPFVKKKRKNAKVETESFGGHKVFVVSPQRYFDSRLGKSRYARYEKYVGNDKLGETIRQYGRTNPKAPIILKNSGNGAMLYLKYGRK